MIPRAFENRVHEIEKRVEEVAKEIARFDASVDDLRRDIHRMMEGKEPRTKMPDVKFPRCLNQLGLMENGDVRKRK